MSKQGFDLWANHYDQTVQMSDETDVYPFAGYKKILNAIFNEVMQKKQASVFDIGFGTGVLTTKLYEHGHFIDGIDFSAEMIAIAGKKMPHAHLLEWDFTKGLPKAMQAKKYDFIISTYALHHLTDEEKVTFLRSLLPMLSQQGKIFIGDIAFSTRQELETCRKENLESWDEDEFYFVFEEINAALKTFCHCEFDPLSSCGGIITISK
ncbi:methyltransferase domain-containing protein [Bacillaceae bacterium Marseille-Q3522]|nr:methyltransferase domain-containing protein [Bacillaceae bacterium Marseille-Q3522]